MSGYNKQYGRNKVREIKNGSCVNMQWLQWVTQT